MFFSRAARARAFVSLGGRGLCHRFFALRNWSELEICIGYIRWALIFIKKHSHFAVLAVNCGLRKETCYFLGRIKVNF